MQCMKDKLSLTDSLAFSYFDEEGDLIFVSVLDLNMINN